MIQMLMVVPNRMDATSFYRSMGPFPQMRKQKNFNMVFSDQADWSIVNMMDMVFMQRPFAPQHLELAKICKQWEIPLWIDYDDLLFDVPTDNPAYNQYMNEQTRNQIVEIIQLSTVCTVSTQQLKNCLQPPKHSLNDRVYVVENALMDFYKDKFNPFHPKQHVNWRGSNTHERDVLEYGEPIIQVAKKNPKSTFSWIGYNPWMVTEGMSEKQAIIVPGMPITEYFEFIRKINPTVQIVPLHTSMFNLCKSNISWIEGTLSGAVSIAPDWLEWRKPGVLTYQNQEDFGSCLEFALNNPQEMSEYHQMSVDYIKTHLMLSDVNRKRIQIMDSLFALSRGKDPKWMEGGETMHLLEGEEAMELQ